jgi:putative ABC transport system permease protein
LILNEAAVRELGLKNPLGTTLNSEEQFLNSPNGDKYPYQVIGVIKDYNYQSLHQPIVPLIFTNVSRFNDVSPQTAIKLKKGNLTLAIQEIEKKWSQFVSDREMEYEFLDQTISNQYNAEIKTQKIFTFFAGLAIFIACIGLFGLAAYACQQRMRELSVRKVLGASASSLVTLLSKNFIKLIVIALVIAFPIAWYLMHRWLQDFTYRIQMSWLSFALAAGMSLGIALLTLSFQTIKASLANPINSLRSE